MNYNEYFCDDLLVYFTNINKTNKYKIICSPEYFLNKISQENLSKRTLVVGQSTANGPALVL